MKYFWVTTNPSIWKVDQIKDGSEEFFTAKNQHGNKRKMWAAFENAHEGDLVLFYESSPTMAVVAEGMVTQGLHERSLAGYKDRVPGICLEYLRDVGSISRELLLISHKTKYLKPLAPGVRLGNLFEITEEDYHNILETDTIESRIAALQVEAIMVYEKQIRSKNINERMEVAKEILNYFPPKPSFKYDSYHGFLYGQGYRRFFNIKAGALIGEVMAHRGHAIILVKVYAGSKYTQKEFEKDLRDLLTKLQMMKQFFDIKNMEICFRLGGTLKLPDWFKSMCQELGIRIRFFESKENEIDGYDDIDLLDDESF